MRDFQLYLLALMKLTQLAQYAECRLSLYILYMLYMWKCLWEMPKIFRELKYSGIRMIIDCADLFIERSEYLTGLVMTWSHVTSTTS